MGVEHDTSARHRCDFRGVLVADAAHFLRRHVDDEVRLAGQQLRDARARASLADRIVSSSISGASPQYPVGLVDDLDVLLVLDDLERAGPVHVGVYRRGVARLDPVLLNDLTVRGEKREHDRVDPVGGHLDPAVDDLGARDAGELVVLRARDSDLGVDPVDAVGDVRRLELVAVVEGDAVADLESDATVFEPLVVRRERVDDVAVGVATEHAVVGLHDDVVGRRLTVVVGSSPESIDDWVIATDGSPSVTEMACASIRSSRRASQPSRLAMPYTLYWRLRKIHGARWLSRRFARWRCSSRVSGSGSCSSSPPSLPSLPSLLPSLPFSLSSPEPPLSEQPANPTRPQFLRRT